MARKVWTPDRIEEVTKYVFSKLVDEQKSLRQIFYFNKDQIELPNLSTFLEWVAKDEAIAEQYARALNVRQAILFDEVVDLADDSKGDVQRNRLQVDARKWALSKMNPKKYGDKIDHTTDGKPMVTPPIQWVTPPDESA